MSKRSRTLLFSAVALVALAGILTALLLLLPAAPEDKEPVKDTSVVLLDKSADKNITVSAAKFVLQEETFELVTTEDENKLLYVKGYEALPLHIYEINELSTALLEITATKKVADAPDNPQSFGFDTDKGCRASVSVTYSDETTFAFEIGNVSPTGEEYYCRVQGQPAVYLVGAEFAESITAPSTTYISNALFSAPEAKEDDDAVVVKDVTLGGSVRKEPIVLHNNGQPPAPGETLVLSGFYLSKPYYHAVNSKSPLITASTFTSATATGVAKVFPSAADLKAYGLEKPYSRCVVNLAIQRSTTTGVGDNKTTTISFHNTFENTVVLGNKDKDGNYYAIVLIEGEFIPAVYLVSPDAVPWAETQYDDVADVLLFFQYVYNLDGMRVTADGATSDIRFEHHAEAEENDDKLTVTIGGKQYDTPGFRSLYSLLLGIYRTGSVDKKPAGTPLFTIELDPIDKETPRSTISLYPYSAGKCVALHETGEMFLVDSKNVNLFLSNYRRYLKGENITN